MMEVIKKENLILLNALDLCDGVITRIDLAICNQYISTKILKMNIAEAERFKPTNYG